MLAAVKPPETEAPLLEPDSRPAGLPRAAALPESGPGAAGVIESLSRQGSGRANEDACVVCIERGVYAVIDGATALGDEALPGSLAASAVAEALRAVSPPTSLLEAVAAANQRIAGAYSAPLTPDAVPAEQRSSCGLAVARLLPGARLEFVHAGDCMIFVQYADGSIRALTRDRVAPLDGIAIAAAHREALRRFGAAAPPLDAAAIVAHLEALRAHVLPVLVRHRRLMNTPDGYSALDGTAAALEFVASGVTGIGDACAVLLLTDGLQLPDAACATYDPQDATCAGDSADAAARAWLDTARFAFEYGAEALCARVDALECADPACFEYPRLKAADDKTAVLLRLSRDRESA
jgi:hypothetical protein